MPDVPLVSSVTPSEAVQPVAEKTAVVATTTQAGPIEVVVPDLGVDKATISEIFTFQNGDVYEIGYRLSATV